MPRHPEAPRIARNVVIGGVGLAVLGGLVGWLVGPDVVGLLFEPEFAPSSTVAMLVAGGVMAAAAAQITGQVLVAEARTPRLAAAWFGGLSLVWWPYCSSAVNRTFGSRSSFAIGEVVALILMAGLAVRRQT